MSFYNTEDGLQYIAKPAGIRDEWNWSSLSELEARKEGAPSGQPFSSRQMKVDYPSPWKGDTVWKQWLDRFESAVASEQNAPSEIQKARKLYSLLEGDAADWITAKFSRMFVTGKVDYKQVVAELEAAPFKHAEDIPVLRERLDTMKMVGSERQAYEKYASAFVRTMGKIEPPVDEGSSCHMFIKGLHHLLKADVLKEAPKVPGYSHREWTKFTPLQTRANELWDVHCNTRQAVSNPGPSGGSEKKSFDSPRKTKKGKESGARQTGRGRPISLTRSQMRPRLTYRCQR
jgi:hypothetical protein